MNRRAFLTAAGLVGLTGASTFAGATKEHTTVKVWFSERAIEHATLEDRVLGYLHAALGEMPVAFNIEIGDQAVRLRREEGKRLMTTIWPRMVLEGTLGAGRIAPAHGVNLLVTDGNVNVVSAGYAVGNAAVVTGARHLARMTPAARTAEVVDYSAPAAVTQLLLHECGHTFGLRHRHGTAVVEDDAIVASPMVGGYAWAPGSVRDHQLDTRVNTCGIPYPSVNERGHRLSLRYSTCARQAIGRLGARFD